MKGALSVQKAHPGIETEAREQGYRVKRVTVWPKELALSNILYFLKILQENISGHSGAKIIISPSQLFGPHCKLKKAKLAPINSDKS